MAFPMPAEPRRVLHPEIEAYASGWMPTEGVHEIYYEESGNPHGLPVIVLHGGPGGAVNPGMRRFFDPAVYRIIMFDQRGCGQSRPHASLEDNTTWTLIDDIERLHWFYQDGASMIFPDAWERFVAPIPEAERGDLMAAYYKRLIGDDVAERERCAVAWSSWEGETVSVEGPNARPDKFAEPDFAVAFARIENWFFTNAGFFEEDGWLLKNVDRMRHIPCWIAQGRFDVVTPISGAWALHRAWPEAHLDIVGDAGHASSEPGIVDSLVRAADWAASLQA